MFGDEDIKIFEVGSKDTGEQASGKPDKTLISAAKKLGRTIAAERRNNTFLFKANRLSLCMNEPPFVKVTKINA